MLPSDELMLVSYLNTKLRDEYDSFDSLVEGLDENKEEIIEKLSPIGYHYNKELNKFVNF